MSFRNAEKWTHKPVCKAQEELVKMFDNGTINENTTSTAAYALHS